MANVVFREDYLGFGIKIVRVPTVIEKKSVVVFDASAVDGKRKFWVVGKDTAELALYAIKATIDQANDDKRGLVRTHNYRGYRLIVFHSRVSGLPPYDGSAMWAGHIEADVPGELISRQHTADDVLDGLRRNIDYWLGIQDIEKKTNAELADYIVKDMMPDVSNVYARFILEIADRLREFGDVRNEKRSKPGDGDAGRSQEDE